MRFRVRWTDRALWKIGRHGVRPDQVTAALEGTIYSRTSGAKVTIIGATHGRTLFIVVIRSKERVGWVEVVTARVATRIEKRLLRRRGKVVR